jgi:hypothetical protein
VDLGVSLEAVEDKKDVVPHYLSEHQLLKQDFTLNRTSRPNVSAAELHLRDSEFKSQPGRRNILTEDSGDCHFVPPDNFWDSILK